MDNQIDATEVPSPERPKGGSRFGWSYLTAASDCPTKWYWRNLAPWPGQSLTVDPVSRTLRSGPLPGSLSVEPARHGLSVGPPQADLSVGERASDLLLVGIESTKFAPALDVGSRVHAGLEAWYRSGVRDGVDTQERSRDLAMGAVRDGLSVDPTGPELEAVALAEKLVANYVAMYGTDPSVEVLVFPDGTPGVEAELWLDLGYGGYQFTSRLDLIYRSNGYLYALEHKTTAASAYGKLVQRFILDGQVSGQYLQLASHFPNEPIGGVTLNAIVKDRAAKSQLPAFSRRTFSRTPAQLEKFRLDMVRKLSQIDQWIEQFIDLLASGVDPHDASLAVFDGTPSGTQCVGMGFACEFFELCANREVAHRLALDDFQARNYEHSYSNPLRGGVK